MAWYERSVTLHERVEFSRLRELYSLMKRWTEHLTDLPWKDIVEFSVVELDDAMGAETADELLYRLKVELRRNFESWKHKLEEVTAKPTPAWARVLRLTEEEAVRYTSSQWKGSDSGGFSSVSSIFAAYRETPFFTLYRDSILLVASRPKGVEFILDHPAYEMETAWMRGFAAVLRPKTQISASIRDGKKLYEWKD